MDDLDRLRSDTASRYLRGQGVEIGAAGRPVRLGPGAAVRYLDLHPRETVASQYGVPPDGMPVADIIDDGAKLTTVPPASLDFLIACHMLEHCEDLFGTLKVHLDRVRPGGHLFYILPDKDRMADQPRSLTPYEHFLADARDGGLGSRCAHLQECRSIYPNVTENSLELLHYHVWDAPWLLYTFTGAREHFGRRFRIEHFEVPPDWPELILVLRRLT